MPETPEEFYARAHGALRTPPVEDWDVWPFDGDVRPRALLPPVEREKARHGEGGVDCSICAQPDDELLWTNEHWRLGPAEPNGLPVVVLLYPREHCDLDTLPPDRAAELGPLLVRVEAAVRAVGGIGRVHVCRWGEGAEHLHWWFMARPAGFPQFASNFAAVWDDVLPIVPDDVRLGNLELVARELRRG